MSYSAITQNVNSTASPTFAGVTVSTTPITVASGGTGKATMTTAYGVLCAGTTATGALQNAGAGTAGQLLVSNGASAVPSWTSPGVIGLSSSLNYNANTTTIRTSTNISSVTHSSAGQFILNFTSAYANGNYLGLLTTSAGPSGATAQAALINSSVAIPTTTTFSVTAAGLVYYDDDYFMVAIF